jgi:uncharacterized repeat protein (TIGR01451 family)
VVLLSIAAGSGTLSASQVTLGANGGGSLILNAPSPGPVTIQATTAGDGRLLSINPTDLQRRPQPTVAATPSQLTASVQVSFQAASPTPPAQVAQTPRPRLSITKSAPPRALVLHNVRYRIVVRNPGSVAARNTVLRDVLPPGMSFVRSSAPGTFRSGAITFRLGTIAAGKQRVVNVWLRANSGVRGTRVNVATVSAAQVRPLSARARTVFRRLARRIQPAVTG